MNYYIKAGSVSYAFSFIIPFVNGQSQSSDTEFPKVFTTVIIIICAVILAVIIAKIVDKFCDKRRMKSDFSDIGLSDHTRMVIRARLKTLKSERKKISRSRTLNFFKIWSSKTKRHHQTKRKERQESTASDKSCVINVVEAQPKNKGTKDIIHTSTVVDNKPIKFHNKVANGETGAKYEKKNTEPKSKPPCVPKNTNESSSTTPASEPTAPPARTTSSSSSVIPKTPSSGRSAAAISFGFDSVSRKSVPKHVKFNDNVKIETCTDN